MKFFDYKRNYYLLIDVNANFKHGDFIDFLVKCFVIRMLRFTFGYEQKTKN